MFLLIFQKQLFIGNKCKHSITHFSGHPSNPGLFIRITCIFTPCALKSCTQSVCFSKLKTMHNLHACDLHLVNKGCCNPSPPPAIAATVEGSYHYPLWTSKRPPPSPLRGREIQPNHFDYNLLMTLHVSSPYKRNAELTHVVSLSTYSISVLLTHCRMVRAISFVIQLSASLSNLRFISISFVIRSLSPSLTLKKVNLFIPFLFYLFISFFTYHLLTL